MKMNCNQIKEVFSEYLDGRIDTRTEGIVRLHLQSCPECQREFNALRNTVNLLATFEPARLSKAFDTRLFARLDALESNSKKRTGFVQSFLRSLVGSGTAHPLRTPWRWAATAGAVAAASLAVWQLVPPPIASDASGGAYIAACVQAHESATIPVHQRSVLEASPGADLAIDTDD